MSNFEFYRIKRVVIEVIPNHNIEQRAATTGENLGPYVIAPWHRPVATTSTITQANLVSIDKHKIYRATQRCRRSFKPNVLLYANDYNQVSWSPKLSTANPGQAHYCALIAFGAGTAYYTVKQTVYATFYEQKINLV